MIIDIIYKNNNNYYILNVKDTKGNWCKTFITERIAELLINGGVKVREKQGK